jgi:hypothetical protein
MPETPSTGPPTPPTSSSSPRTTNQAYAETTTQTPSSTATATKGLLRSSSNLVRTAPSSRQGRQTPDPSRRSGPRHRHHRRRGLLRRCVPRRPPQRQNPDPGRRGRRRARLARHPTPGRNRPPPLGDGAEMTPPRGWFRRSEEPTELPCTSPTGQTNEHSRRIRMSRLTPWLAGEMPYLGQLLSPNQDLPTAGHP